MLEYPHQFTVTCYYNEAAERSVQTGAMHTEPRMLALQVASRKRAYKKGWGKKPSGTRKGKGMCLSQGAETNAPLKRKDDSVGKAPAREQSGQGPRRLKVTQRAQGTSSFYRCGQELALSTCPGNAIVSLSTWEGKVAVSFACGITSSSSLRAFRPQDAGNRSPTLNVPAQK